MIEWAITSSALILVVLVLRRVLMGRISLRLQYGLWALVLARLLLPVNFGETAWSVLNLAESVLPVEERTSAPKTEETNQAAPKLSIVEPDEGLDPRLSVVEPDGDFSSELPQVESGAAADPEFRGMAAVEQGLVALWAVGAVGVGLWFLGVNVWFAGKLRRSRVPLTVANCPLPVYVTGTVQTPCLFGLLRPCIYVTQEAAANETVLRHSLAHELTHFRHGDHIWAALRGLCLAVHWYNPFVWVAAALSRRDGELCCDESTVRRLGEGERAAYGRTLLAVTCQGHSNPLFTATSMTGGGSGIKARVVLLAKRPQTALYTLAAVVLLAAIAVGCTFTGAEKGGGEAEITLAAEIEVPQAVSDYAREYVQEQRNFYTEKEGYTITGAEIVGLTQIGTGTAAENSGVNLYRLEYRLKAARPEEVVLADGMTMEDGAITEWSSAGQPYLMLYWEDSGEETVWKPICVVDDWTITEQYGTPEMLEKYGDAYTAAAMELYESGDKVVTKLISADLDRDGAEEEIWLEEWPGDYYELVVKKQDGTELYREGAGLAHVGWKSLYLYTDDRGEASLLRYTPYISTGTGGYSYTRFTLEGGTETVLEEGELGFDVSQVPELREELIAFADEVNALLRHSSLLLSTQDAALVVGPVEANNYLEDLSSLQEIWSKASWTPGPGDASLPEEPIELLFASGAGGWGTTLTLSPDGSFVGDYSDMEMGDTPPTRYVCSFHGQFADIRQTGARTWSLTLSELTTERPEGEIWTEEGLRHVSSKALGVAGGTEFILYAPGTSVYDLPAACRDWWPGDYLWRLGEQDSLDGWGLYNITTGEGFFQR